MPVRPTTQCLREDLALPVPHASVPLYEIDHCRSGQPGAQGQRYIRTPIRR